MANISTSGAVLPEGEALSDEDIADALQAHVVGITGMDGQLVRPRWQKKPPAIPEPLITWAALGTKSNRSDDSPYLDQSIKAMTYVRHEAIEVLISFYGPNAYSSISQLRDGFYIPQNNRSLLEIGAKFIGCGEILSVPELVGTEWVQRYDMTYNLRRKEKRLYPLLPFDIQPDINTLS